MCSFMPATLALAVTARKMWIWRIDTGELDGLHPKVLVLMIGTNNSRTNSPEQIAEGIKVILDKIQEKCPDTKVLLLGCFPAATRSRTSRRRSKLRQDQCDHFKVRRREEDRLFEY